MDIERVPKSLMCRASPRPCKIERGWFQSLKPGSISSFMELSKKFVEHYRHYISNVVISSNLFSINQGPYETMKNYQIRFKELCVNENIRNLKERKIMSAFKKGLQLNIFADSLLRNAPVNRIDLWYHAHMEVQFKESRARYGLPALSQVVCPTRNSRG